ncbi:MAG: hypothetical protein ACP5HS_10070 [Anaerolineae bacterium]
MTTGACLGFQRRVSPGDILGPWLVLGPFYQDLSDRIQGLTLFERAGATVGVTAMEEIVAEAHPILVASPREAEAMTFRSEVMRWRLVRRPEEYLSWGQYNLLNHLGAAFLTTRITLDRKADEGNRSYHWRLLTTIPSRAVVAINGEIVYDTAPHPVRREQGAFEYAFEAQLPARENVVTVGLFRIARMAQVGCRLEIADAEVLVQVPGPQGITAERRLQIEEEVRGLRLDRDVLYPHHAAEIAFRSPPKDPVEVGLFAEDGQLVAQAQGEGVSTVTLCPAATLPDGAYALRATWKDQDGAPITEVAYDLKKVSPVIAPTGPGAYEARKERVLAHYADNQENRPIWSQVARYALHRAGVSDVAPVDEGVIRETCAFIAARKDCADFVIQGVLRLMAWEREERRLSPELNALMKDTVLGFKYWVDEPGDTVMYMGSENHRLLFHVAEWMAGQLFPTEEFTNSRQRGLYHATKGRTYITEWLRQRGRFGFDEWHSNSYFPIDIAPLLNVYDFAIYEDYKLRQMAGAALDYLFFDLAADSYKGVFGTTHGRSYGIYVKYPDFEGTASTCWLLYGTGALTKGTSGMAPVCLATSAYEPPTILNEFANDTQAVIEARERQGVLRGATQSANFIVYRTPDYMLSGLQDHRKGEFEPSSHVAQVTLGQKVREDGQPAEQQAVIFWSCPLTSGEGSGLRPDYWSGHIALPRAIQYRNVLALTWRLPKHAWMTHCFFEPARFDEVRLENNWAFARVGEGYVGIYSQHGLAWGDHGQYAGRELVCTARENTWLVECGRGADWGSFDAFVDALLAAEATEVDGTLIYASPSIGRFSVGWEGTPTVQGAPIHLHGYPLVDSPWAHADFGSGELTLRHGDETYEIWFNQ